MSYIRYLLYCIVLQLVHASPQINLHLTDWIINNETNAALQHDCLYVAASIKSVKDPHQVISYCMGEWSSKWNIQNNSMDQIFTFAQLFKLNITSQQLYLWSAPMDTVEYYQLYLDELFTSNERSLVNKLFYNCTWPRFGPMCQYSLDDDKSPHSSLNEIIYDFYLNNRYEPITLTCYTLLQCDLGSSLLCLDWSDICDERIACLDGIDEEYCWQMEINQCKENEYRCKNGQCIPVAFLDDNPDAPDCLDRSEENKLYEQFYYNSMTEPTFRYEDVTCSQRTATDDYYQSPFTISCIENRNDLIVQSMFSERANSTSEVCWSALMCYFRFIDLSTLQCDEFCQNETYTEIIQNNCPDMFYVPAVPVLFGHIYLAYTKEYIVNSSICISKPEYVCYNEQLCSGFESNKTLIFFNNTTCRRPEDFPLEFGWGSDPNVWYLAYVKSLYLQLSKCNTLIRNNSVFCDRSTMYKCVNSSKCISKIRLIDGMLDCDYGDDEQLISVNDICSMNHSYTHFTCEETNHCISRKLVRDGKCHCLQDSDDLCDDEYTDLTYIRKHISFPTICDGFTELKYVMIDGRDETDETACDQWPCNNTYTRCDGLWNCLNGADEVDCYPSSLLDCPPRNHICVSRNTSDFICLSLDKVNNNEIDCLGATDEPDLCRTSEYSSYENEFYCETIYWSNCISDFMLCDGVAVCIQGDDEQFCSNFSHPPLGSISMCSQEYILLRSDVEEFFCNRLNVTRKSKIVHFSLDKVRNSSENTVRQDTNMVLTRSSTVQNSPRREQRCHRGLDMRIWLDGKKNLTDIACLCPSNFYGDKCQYQNQRISLTIGLQASSDSWRTPFILVVSLIDDSDERIIHSHEQLTYLSMQNCERKFNIYLLYSTRSKNQSKKYSIHIDIYEKISLAYRGSLLLPVSFPFLPVQRIAVQLKIPNNNDHAQTRSGHRCLHGKYIKYSDGSNDTSFCQCDRGWSGRYCNLQHTCECSSDSLCIGVLANNRSLCVCPIHKWGSRCLLHDQVCHSNQNPICQNGGQCIPVDQYIVSNKKFECICPKRFMGDKCEIPDKQMIISFEKDIILPESMFVHFIEAKDDRSPENGITFKRIPINQNSAIVYWSRPFHIAFIEFIANNYYLIDFQATYNRSETIVKTLKPSDRCMNISEVFNETFAQLNLLRRIKYYHLPCQRQSPPISCFYDDVHMCLCTYFGLQRVVNCFEFNHNMKLNCAGRSHCEHGAQCLQDSMTCPKTSMCVCPKCFHGARCQFSSSRFGLSLDGILGYNILQHINLTKQPSIVQISVVLTIIMTVAGLIDGVLSLITFMNKDLLKFGCGRYLLASSITTLVTMTLFALKFSILIISQMIYNTNRSFLHFQCISLDFLLRIGINTDQWLNASVAIERVIIAKKGINFDQKKSKTMAKYVILVVIVLTISTAVQDPFHRRLIDDGDDDDNDKRIWCTVSYPPYVQVFDSVVNTFHFFAPFFINLISAILINGATTRQQIIIRPQQNIRKLLYEQLQQHKHVLVAPLILISLAVPRLITSFVSGCMKSGRDSWLFLAGYFISFIPPMLTFVIFVLPSKFYISEFRKTVVRWRKMLRTCLHLMP